LGFCPRCKQSFLRPTEGIRAATRRRGRPPFLALPPAASTRAVGFLSLRSDTAGAFNTAIGAGTLLANTADENTATGAGALLSNTIGIQNTANGAFALFRNTEGNFNTANGLQALFFNTTGASNTANGFSALYNNTTGTGNTAIGYGALSPETSGNLNTALGVFAGDAVTTANNVICIGASGANVSDTCFIGNIRGVTTQNANAVPVLIDSAGQLGTVSSSRRFKKEIKPMDSASEAILALKPVTFHYNTDKTNTPQFGLIAEEVAEVNPDLVVRDENGEIYTVRYDQVNAMLLNEFLKEHCKVQEQEATITQLKRDFGATIAQLTARLDEQASQIQKVSVQFEMNKPAPQVVNNP
jgi:Chaperone of endosialidase